MFIRNESRNKDKVLLIAGASLIALRSMLQQFVDRSGHSSDTTDFLLGAMMGVGLGLLFLFVWRLRRKNPPDRLA